MSILLEKKNDIKEFTVSINFFTIVLQQVTKETNWTIENKNLYKQKLFLNI